MPLDDDVWFSGNTLATSAHTWSVKYFQFSQFETTPYSNSSSPTEMIFALEVITYLLFSSIGLAVNVHLFVNFYSKLHGSSEFNTLCLAKTLPNILVCFTYLTWSAPLSAFNVPYEHVPAFLGALIGQVNIGATYIARPIIQVFMAICVWFLITFPLRKSPIRTSTVIFISVVMASLVIVYTVLRTYPCEKKKQGINEKKDLF